MLQKRQLSSSVDDPFVLVANLFVMHVMDCGTGFLWPYRKTCLCNFPFVYFYDRPLETIAVSSLLPVLLLLFT